MNSVLLNVPVGAIIDYAGNSVPSGYLECDGSLVSRSEYPALFSVIGDTWGEGDGSTTFNLPNLNGRVTLGVDASNHVLGDVGGSETHTLTEEEMPSHTHTTVLGSHTHPIRMRYNPSAASAGNSLVRWVVNGTNATSYGGSPAEAESVDLGSKTSNSVGGGLLTALCSPTLRSRRSSEQRNQGGGLI